MEISDEISLLWKQKWFVWNCNEILLSTSSREHPIRISILFSSLDFNRREIKKGAKQRRKRECEKWWQYQWWRCWGSCSRSFLSKVKFVFVVWMYMYVCFSNNGGWRRRWLILGTNLLFSNLTVILKLTPKFNDGWKTKGKKFWCLMEWLKRNFCQLLLKSFVCFS